MIKLAYMSEQEYKAQLKHIELENESKERKRLLKKEKHKYSKRVKLPSTTKLIAVYLFALLNVVLAYAMYTMFVFQDLQYLGVLITDIAAQVITYFLYLKKSAIENSAGGITYELAMLKEKSKTLEENDDEAVG